MLSSFKSRFMGTAVSTVWHRTVPHIAVSRKMNGLRVFFDLNDNIDDLTRPSLLERELSTQIISREIGGQYWDIGCNIGQFAIPAAAAGHPVVAFDISMRACRLLRKSAVANRLPITVIEQAITIHPCLYSPPITARPTERMGSPSLLKASVQSLGLEDAWRTYGPPALVKMDIEGSENDFLNSQKWRELFQEAGFYWLLEVHPPITRMESLWGDVPHLLIDKDHYLFHRTGDEFKKLQGLFAGKPH